MKAENVLVNEIPLNIILEEYLNTRILVNYIKTIRDIDSYNTLQKWDDARSEELPDIRLVIK